MYTQSLGMHNTFFLEYLHRYSQQVDCIKLLPWRVYILNNKVIKYINNNKQYSENIKPL